MAAAGINTVRVYTAPPEWLLDRAAGHALRVMIGLPWAQHIAFLDDRVTTRQVRADAVKAVRRLSAHPAALLFALGNEIPPGVVRWHGRRRVERFLRELYDDVKASAPASLLTYVNFPPTEYLDLDVFDVCAFNVYLHQERDLRAYLARLQHLAGARPLLLAEAGADSVRQGADGQARLTASQIRAAFAEGACGAVAFAWTDEWWRGGETVTDWAFGLVDRTRTPKPSLASVQEAFAEVPFAAHERKTWPRVSVVVCAYNAAATIDECLTSLEALDYPDVEVIVVNDGSRDDTATIARRHPRVRVISVPNGGLSAARNIGLAEATSEIVAYTDADVRVDPAWLTYLVQPMLTSDVAGSGGPNVVPPDDPFVAQCVARAPGGPTHVLLDDRIAEHVPGCNMAFRREALLAIGGFNPVYVRAGDDVDICWRLQAKGQRIGFAPAALVWHRHRASVRGYWRQQVGYGEGETWLDAHHPEKFLGGQMLWRGHIYSPLPFVRSLSGQRMNTGVWGTAAFPSIYRTEVGGLQFLPHSAVWMLAASAACVLGALALLSPYKIDATLLGAAGLLAWAVSLGRVARFAAVSNLAGLSGTGTRYGRLRYRALILWLHLLQPVARAYGRLRGMWTPRVEVEPERATGVLWKAPVPSAGHVSRAALLLVGGSVEQAFWSERWISHGSLLTELSATLRAARPTRRVALDDGWHADRDVGLAVSRWGWLHVRALVEEHEGGRCLCRFGIHLRPSFAGAVAVLAVALGLAALSSVGATLQWRSLTVVSMIAAAVLIVREAWHTTGATALLERSLDRVASGAGMMPVPASARAGRGRVIRLPRTAAQAAQAAALAIVAAGSAASLVSIDRDFTIRERAQVAALPQPRPQPVAAVPAPAGGVAVLPSGDLFLADTRRGRVEQLRPRRPLQPVALSAGAVAGTLFTSVGGYAFPGAADVGLTADGDLVLADPDRSRISRIDVKSGRITTVAGTGAVAFSADGGPATNAALGAPRGVAVAPNGDVYIADTLNNRVRVVEHATGLIRTIAGNGAPGVGSALGDGGPATLGHLWHPSGLALAPNGDVYVADTGHHRVRRIDAAAGLIATVAGTGVPGALGDGGRATLAHLSSPMGVAVAAEGRGVRLYIADTMNDRVRVVNAAGRVSTLRAGPFARPTRVVYQASGWVYVKDDSAAGVTTAPAGGAQMEATVAPRRIPPRKMT
jgi:GT2 family glycosyltransferase/sugar lactone lactonase YvrE